MCLCMHANVSECPLYGNDMNYSLLTDEEAFRLPGVELRRMPHLYLQALSVSSTFPIHLLYTFVIILIDLVVDATKMLFLKYSFCRASFISVCLILLNWMKNHESSCI
ncbi:hypothetical protein AMECASPLE_035219 [Ameca splendens]|uniref:Uncharacterized protein n=1 Tax=Ameca splendens TaxID=208324 RepID=A0ABV0Y7M7_9TELE